MTEIKLYNTKTRKKEVFRPLDPENVRMYVCGPTVYDRAHIGNARPVIVFDTLYRLLRHVYGPEHVTYARNFTDVDDKINARAAETGRNIKDITDETIQWYLDDMGALGALEPNLMPRATEYIGQMIEMIEELIAKGHAYAAEGHVLFDVNSYEHYGTLSGRSIKDMIAGARVEVAPYKRDPMDFVLWKPSSDDLPGWDSPWGRGRPGWHIECSAMSRALFGERFDIHGGGLDLAFPHHENEKAQSCSICGEDCFAQVWMHNEMVQVEGKKMSKSLGNFFTVRDLLKEFDRDFAIQNIGPAIRLRFLQTHYRAPVDAGPSHIEAAAAKIDDWMHWLQPYLGEAIGDEERRQLIESSPVLAAVADDLNTPMAISAIDAMISSLKKLPQNGSIINEFADDQLKTAKLAIVSIGFLGFNFDELEGLRHRNWSAKLKERSRSGNPALAQEIDRLLGERASARNAKNFARADMLRDGLMEAGVIVKDTSNGVEWELSPSFDPAKLEALI